MLALCGGSAGDSSESEGDASSDAGCSGLAGTAPALLQGLSSAVEVEVGGAAAAMPGNAAAAEDAAEAGLVAALPDVLSVASPPAPLPPAPPLPAVQQLPPVELPPVQRWLSELLLRLFGDADVIKAGFGLGTDLSHLCESYPGLPCFGSEGPVPLR